MLSYIYCNGVYQVTTYVRDGFKRFHTMNAQHSVFDIDERFRCWQFVSYATEICQITYDYKYHIWHACFNGNPFAYSSSTSRQVSRWLRELNDSVNCPITPNIVRMAIDNARALTPEHSDYIVSRENDRDEMVLDFYDDSRYYHFNVWR